MEAPLLNEIIAIHFEKVTAEKSGGMNLHLHHCYQLDVILEGQVTVYVEGQRPFRGRAGQAWLIPPLVRHDFKARSPYRQGSFKFHLSPRYWSTFGRQLRRFDVSRDLLARMENTGMRHRGEEPLARQMIWAVVTLCLLECADQPAARFTESDNLQALHHLLYPLLEHIEREPHLDWSVGKMARDCYLSRSYFSRSFRRLIGQTAQQCILEARMKAAAADLLTFPPRPIKEVADRARYTSVHTFGRSFKRVFGISPAAYRSSSTMS